MAESALTNAKNPIENVFLLNMREGLFKFEKHYEELKTRLEKKKSVLKSQTLSQEELHQQLQQVEHSFNYSVELVVEAYDRYMKASIPTPELLPIRLFLKILSKNLTLDLHVPQTHTSQDLEQVIKDHFASKGDLVESLEPGKFTLQETVFGEEVPMEDPLQPIGVFKPVQGSCIYYGGNLVLKSESPKVCFRSVFEKGRDMTVNYYSCAECRMNWVCESCVWVCHKNHAAEIAIPNHKPTWACCNCAKKGNCVLRNKS